MHSVLPLANGIFLPYTCLDIEMFRIIVIIIIKCWFNQTKRTHLNNILIGSYFNAVLLPVESFYIIGFVCSSSLFLRVILLFKKSLV